MFYNLRLDEFIPALVLSGGAFMIGIYHLLLYLQYRERIILRYSLYLFSIVLYICFALYFRSVEGVGPAPRLFIINEAINFIAILCYASFLLEIAAAWKNVFRLLFLAWRGFTIIALLYIGFCIVVAFSDSAKFAPIINAVSSILKVLIALVGIWAAILIFPKLKGRFVNLIVGGALIYLFFMALVLITMFLIPARHLLGLSPIQWFYLGTFIEIVVFTYAMSVRIREVLNRVTDLRTRLSQDLHDEIGATLTSISFLSEIAKQSGREEGDRNNALEKIGEYSREMIAEISDIVWAINPKNDRLDKVTDRMKNFGQTLLASRNIAFHFHAGQALDRITLNSQQRKNLYLVFKEAITNAAKYSGCGQLTVLLEMDNQAIRMRISDDGKGFSTTKGSGGNGIINMHNRAAELGGVLTFESNKNKGTEVDFLFPVTQNA